MKPMSHKRIIERELEGFGIRLNKEKPDIKINKLEKGGVQMRTNYEQNEMDLDFLKSILHEYKLMNAEVVLNQPNVTSEQVVDTILGNRVYVPCIYVLNKIDSITIKELELIYTLPHCIPISAEHKWNFDDLLDMMWEYMDLIRLYTKPPGEVPDFTQPLVLKRSKRQVADFCNKLHRHLLDQFKHALVWGKSVKHVPQIVGRDHVLDDEDVIQIIKR
ncbi:MAG: GTP-binding protein [Paramarteilia canceri]